MLTGQHRMASQCYINPIRLTIKVGIVRDPDDTAMVTRRLVQTGTVYKWLHEKGLGSHVPFNHLCHPGPSGASPDERCPVATSLGSYSV
jgi:hypothetical protein